jgi:glycosyltransferase involved in cell wall biosynthesis
VVNKGISVFFLPEYQNPYQHLLKEGLENEGITVDFLQGIPSIKWLLQNKNQPQILHLHWLSGLYMRRYLTLIRLTNFLGKIFTAQLLGYKIVWTVHNILPHKLPFPPMHKFVRRFMMQRADAVITHCEYGYNKIIDMFPRKKSTYVIPIGSYSGIYPITLTKSKARLHLGIDKNQFVYLFLGNITRYKGIDHFVDIFQSNASSDDIAIIAGRNRDNNLVKNIKSMAAQDPRIRIHAGYIPDEQIQLFLLASDVMVLPFKDILTSSSVITGMSYQLPIIAPALGCLPELITPNAGILYDSIDPDGLKNAIFKIKELDTTKMGNEAKTIADSLKWNNIAIQTIKVYQNCLDP